MIQNKPMDIADTAATAARIAELKTKVAAAEARKREWQDKLKVAREELKRSITESDRRQIAVIRRRLKV